MSKPFDIKFEAWKHDQGTRKYPEDTTGLAESADTNYERDGITVDSLMKQWGID